MYGYIVKELILAKTTNFSSHFQDLNLNKQPSFQIPNAKYLPRKW